MSQQPFNSDGGFSSTANIVIGNVLVVESIGPADPTASPAPSLNGFDSINSITVSATGNVTGGNIITSGSGGDITMTGGNITGAGTISLNSGYINGGAATVVDDGINSISLSLGAQMDVFTFPFSVVPTRGQLTISGDITTTEALGTWYYQATSTNAYQLYTDSTYSTLVDATTWTPYTGGGIVAITLQNPASNIVINSNGFTSTFNNIGQLNLPGSLTAVGDIGTDGNLYVHDATVGGNINGAGNFDLDGDASIGGNLFVTGNINFTGNVTQISGNSGVFFGNASTGVGALYAGKTGYTPLPSTIVQMTGDDNAYIQTNLQNTNHGNTASMELAITADDGTDVTNYIDMGIASSTWDGTQDNSLGTAVAARDGYLYVQGGSAGGNLVLGTTTSGYTVKFNAGGPGSANTVAQISSTGITTTGIVSATGNVRGANLNTAGVVSAVGNIIGNYILGNGSQLTGITVSGSNPVSTTGNVSAGNLVTTGTVSANNIGNIASLNLNGNASTVLYGNGVFAAVAAGSNYGNSNVATFLAAFGSNTVSTTGNITSGNILTSGLISATGNITGGNLITSGTFQSASLSSSGNLTFTANTANLVFNTGAYISGNANSIGRDGSIVLQPAATGTFQGVVIGGAGRLLAPNGSVHQVFNASDVTFQVTVKAPATVSTSTTTGGIQAGGGVGVVGNIYAGNVYSPGLASVTGNATVGNLLTAGQVSSTGNIVTAGNFVGNGAALTNVTVSVAGNVVGTQPNVNIVAGSYTYTFDNTGNVTLPTGGDLVFSANTTLTSVGGTNGNITINPDGTGQLVVTNITPAYFGNSVAITGPIRTGNGSYANNPGNGDIVFNNGGIDTPGVTFYYGNNTNFGIDSYSGNAITTPNYLRIVKNLNEAGAAELIKIDQGGNISFAGSAMSIFTTQRKFDWTAMIHGNPATGGSITGSLLGNASYTNVSDGVTLTPNTTGQSGSVAWNTTTFDFTKDFVMEWSWFTSTGGVNPADGVWATFGGNTNGGAASPAGTTNGSIGLRYQTFTNLKTQWYSNGATTGNAVAFRAGVTYQGEWQTSRIMVRTVSNKRYAYVYTGVGGVCDNAIDVTSWTPAGTWIAVGASTGSATSGQLCCHVALEYL